MNNMRLRGVVLLAVFCFMCSPATAAPISGIEATSLELVSKTRSGRSSFDYVYRATFMNTGPAARNVVGLVSSEISTIIPIDNRVDIGKVPGNATVTSDDTITLRVDRRTPFDPMALSWAFDGDIIDDVPPSDDDESLSGGRISTVLTEGTLYPVGTDVVLTVTGAEFSLNENEVTFLHNEKIVKSLTVSPGEISAPNLLVDGRNEIVMYTNDSNNHQLTFGMTLWAGSHTAYINVVNESGQSVTADLKLRLADDETVGTDAVAQEGIYQAIDLPARTVIIEATTSSNEFGSAALIGGMDTAITIEVKGIGEASAIDNNDFSQGLSGWTIRGGGSVTIIPESD